jgi:general secretion pathway protein C
MVMIAGKDFAQTLRGGIAVTCDVVGVSALGVSLAALAWAVAAPRGANAAPAASNAAEDRLTTVVARLSRIDDPFLRGGAQLASATTNATGFVLHATRALGQGEGTAIISPTGGQQGAFAVGEEITPGVVLSMVASDHVEIDVGGQRMRVAFPNAQAAPVIQMASRLPADYSAAAAAASVPALPGLPLQPVSRNGQPAGFEVMPHADAGVLASAGLRPGDLVLSVNGVSAANADLAAYRAQLLSGQPVEIRFERGGQVMTARLGN